MACGAPQGSRNLVNTATPSHCQNPKPRVMGQSLCMLLPPAKLVCNWAIPTPHTLLPPACRSKPCPVPSAQPSWDQTMPLPPPVGPDHSPFPRKAGWRLVFLLVLLDGQMSPFCTCPQCQHSLFRALDKNIEHHRSRPFFPSLLARVTCRAVFKWYWNPDISQVLLSPYHQADYPVKGS